MKVIKYSAWFLLETAAIILFLAWWWRQKGGDTMKTYASIKCGLKARIEGLEMMVELYEKDNPMRHNTLIRIDECNRLMRILTVLENDKENENELGK